MIDYSNDNLMEIKDEKLKKAILIVLADENMLNILILAKENIISGNDIIKKLDISHSTAYRKIKWMLENDLLVVEKIDLTPDGKKFSLFRSTIISAIVKYDGKNNTIVAEQNTNFYRELPIPLSVTSL